MSEGMNRVTLLGHLGADPELKTTAQGATLLQLRMATTEIFVDKNKELQERTEWHDVVLWGNRAEPLSRLLGKGDLVLVEGGLRTSNWEKEGQKKYRTEIIASNVWLTGRKRSDKVNGSSAKRPERAEEPYAEAS